MSEKISISGESRQETGKANSRGLRSSEIVPGVIYGEEKSSNIKVLEKDLKKILENPSIFSQVIDLNIDGSLDVLDIVILVNMILGMEEPNYDIGDMDQDGILTVLDVILLINTILDN